MKTPKGWPDVSPGWSHARNERGATLGMETPPKHHNPEGVVLKSHQSQTYRSSMETPYRLQSSRNSSWNEKRL
jgi:hypothetical protein